MTHMRRFGSLPPEVRGDPSRLGRDPWRGLAHLRLWHPHLCQGCCCPHWYHHHTQADCRGVMMTIIAIIEISDDQVLSPRPSHCRVHCWLYRKSRGLLYICKIIITSSFSSSSSSFSSSLSLSLSLSLSSNMPPGCFLHLDHPACHICGYLSDSLVSF